MKPLFLLAAILVFGTSTNGGDKEPAPKQSEKKPLQIKVSICEGDPLGSREANTQRLLAEPTLASMENQPFRFHSGGEFPHPDDPKVFLPYGITFEGKWAMLKDDNVRLDVNVSLSTRVVPPTGDGIQIQTVGFRRIMTVKVGDVIRFRLGKGTGDEQMWVELIAQELPNVPVKVGQ